MPYHLNQRKHELRGLLDRIGGAVYTPLGDLTVAAWVTPEPVAYADRESGRKLELTPGDKWGDLFDCAWFHFTGSVPAEAQGKPVVLLIDVNGEMLVVDGQGNPRQGLTNVSSGYDWNLGAPGKRVVPLVESAAGGEAIDLWGDAGCNDLFGELKENGTLKEARMAVLQPTMRALYYDYEVLHDLMGQLPEDSARWHRIFSALEQAALALTEFDECCAAKAREALAPELARQGADPPLTVSAIGHSHIDLAWLWPIRETIRKGARTFATALRFMEQYPDYVFGASQPQLFQWMKDHYPTLYTEVKQRVAEGRWEVQGGMWVESDTNVPSGESLVRQLLYGKRFYRDEFGIEVKGLWLPDVFGYSGALPQILVKSGLDWFMTQKISWNSVNRFPHQTFFWQGIDGTRILSHFLPEETYNSPAAPRAIARAECNFHDKAVSDRVLLLFGIGDGGGGPGEEHLERLARERNLQGIAPVVQEPSQRFFEHIARDTSRLKTWVGELYLERHQGTYTTQARSKRYNRKMELALREAEWACARAAWTMGAPYPREELDAIWKEMLLYQFHDILPGSSITRVYTESLARYAEMLSRVEGLLAAAEASLYGGLEIAGLDKPYALVNSLSWERTEWVEIENAWRRVTAPACGWATVDLAGPLPEYVAPTAESGALENELLRVEFAEDGSIARILDKEAGREVLLPGECANRLALYEDWGDAWDFSMGYRDLPPKHFALQSTSTTVDGPRASITQQYAFGASTLRQEIVLFAGGKRLDFLTHVDWRESNKMLRTSFPLAVQASEVTCEIQFGSLKRPTHRNTSWDLARDEICAQRWIDLSERGYGVALLNDCKYGHRAEATTLDIDLLRSPGHPDPVADRAEHDFTYSLLPHLGDHAWGGVVRAAQELNVPLRAIALGGCPGAGARSGSFATVDAPNVILDTVKMAEDGEALILRFYEAHGESARARVSLGVDAGSAALVDLMEENPRPLALEGNAVTLDLAPFEIVTVKLSR